MQIFEKLFLLLTLTLICCQRGKWYGNRLKATSLGLKVICFRDKFPTKKNVLKTYHWVMYKQRYIMQTVLVQTTGATRITFACCLVRAIRLYKRISKELAENWKEGNDVDIALARFKLFQGHDIITLLPDFAPTKFLHFRSFFNIVTRISELSICLIIKVLYISFYFEKKKTH